MLINNVGLTYTVYKTALSLFTIKVGSILSDTVII